MKKATHNNHVQYYLDNVYNYLLVIWIYVKRKTISLPGFEKNMILK
jgi:hypothetical protein